MRILITTFGTRGDIQPFVALGQGLQHAGHDVALCTSEGFRPFVEEYGLSYAFMDNEMLRLSQEVLEAAGVLERVRIARQMPPAMRRSMDDEWNAARAFQPDLIVYHPKCLGSYHIAEKLGIPAVLSLPLPLYTPTSAFPVPFFAALKLGGRINRLSFRFIALSSAMFTGGVNDFRSKTLNLAPVGRLADLLVRSDGSPVPILYPYSPSLLPVPEEFPPHVHVTGYWFLDHATGWQPDPELVRFLEEGPPPIYVGFGSMVDSQTSRRTRMVLDALEQSQQRGVLATGWGALKASELPRSVYAIDSVPHDWLFPRVAAVVHHGGAGTTAAGLRAGKPTIICPFLGDQPFWGKLVYERGVGPEPILQIGLTTSKLASAIGTAVTDEGMRAEAARLGGAIRQEQGVIRAVEAIGAFAGRPPGRSSVQQSELERSH